MEAKPVARALWALVWRWATAAAALVAGGVLVHQSWGFIFREYPDSPLWVYALFSAPKWVPGLLLVAVGCYFVWMGAGTYRTLRAGSRPTP